MDSNLANTDTSPFRFAPWKLKYHNEWYEACRNVKIEGAIPTQFALCQDNNYGEWYVRTTIWVKDVDSFSREKVAVVGKRILYPDQPPTMPFFLDLANESWLHELKETMKVNGALMFDPHKTNRVCASNNGGERWWDYGKKPISGTFDCK